MNIHINIISDNKQSCLTVFIEEQQKDKKKNSYVNDRSRLRNTSHLMIIVHIYLYVDYKMLTCVI